MTSDTQLHSLSKASRGTPVETRETKDHQKLLAPLSSDQAERCRPITRSPGVSRFLVFVFCFFPFYK